MKKITLSLIITFLSSVGFAQQKSTGTISLSNGIPITANFTLNNATSQVTLILTGPADRWFGIGIGVLQGFGMEAGDALVFTTTTTPNLTDRNFIGTGNPPQDASQDWTTNSNTVNGNVRTLNVTRSLITTETTNDFQLPYATTNSISFAGARPSGANISVGSHGGSSNAGYVVNAPFTTLGLEDFSLAASHIFPNPSNGAFSIKTKTTLEKINVYTQTGSFVKSIEITDASEQVEVNITELQTGIYLLELVNETEKYWKKVIVE